MRNTKTPEKSIEQQIVPSNSLIEIGPDELRAVVGGRKPVVEITIKPDGTIVIVQK
ncbi:hypothetical protein [Hyalangium versicolor]|uniref:hypothetical protein n=1 Tax=Hyalangium versicolor TaxID=2861190 RepID=UPI001CCAE4A7|nr:hypothetical protein [Hyalangium versicolor]